MSVHGGVRVEVVGNALLAIVDLARSIRTARALPVRRV